MTLKPQSVIYLYSGLEILTNWSKLYMLLWLNLTGVDRNYFLDRKKANTAIFIVNLKPQLCLEG